LRIAGGCFRSVVRLGAAGVEVNQSYCLERNCSTFQEWGNALAYNVNLPNMFLSLVSKNGYWMEGSIFSRVGGEVGPMGEGGKGHELGGGGAA